MRYKVYFFCLGIISMFLGLLSILAVVLGKDANITIIEFTSDAFRGGWGGIILLSAGLFYVHGIKRLDDIHHRAEVFVGSGMIWILGGCEILRMILMSIPGEEGWLNTPEGFVSSYLPPYHPSILLLPFSLVVWMMERYYEKRGCRDSQGHK